MTKHSIKNNRVKRIFIYLFTQVATTFFSFLFSPFLARSLSLEDFAVYNQVLLFSSLLTITFSMGIPMILLHLFQKNESRIDKYLSSISLISIIIGLVSFIVLFSLANFSELFSENKNISFYIKLYSPFFIFYFLNTHFNLFLIYSNKLKVVSLIVIVSSLLNILLQIIAIMYFKSLTYAIVVIGLIIPIFQFVSYFTFTKKKLTFDIVSLRVTFKEMLSISWPLWITSILGSSYGYGSGIIINYYLDDKSFALFRAGAFEIPLISSIAMSASTILMAEVSTLYSQNKIDEIKLIINKIINTVSSLIYPIIFFAIIYSKELITLYMTNKYTQSSIVFSIYSSMLLIRIIDYQMILTVAEKTKYILLGNILYFVLNFFLMITLVKPYGINGVAISNAISVFILAIYLLNRNARVLNVRVSELFNHKKMISLVCIICFLLILTNFVFTDNIIMPLKILYSALFYFITTYVVLFKFNFLDKSLVLNLIKK